MFENNKIQRKCRALPAMLFMHSKNTLIPRSFHELLRRAWMCTSLDTIPDTTMPHLIHERHLPMKFLNGLEQY